MPKFFYKIVNGIRSYNGEVIKSGDIVEWTPEQAKGWFPNQRGWIEMIDNPSPPEPAHKPEPEPTKEPESEKVEVYAEKEPEPEEAKPETKAEPEKITRVSKSKRTR